MRTVDTNELLMVTKKVGTSQEIFVLYSNKIRK